MVRAPDRQGVDVSPGRNQCPLDRGLGRQTTNTLTLCARCWIGGFTGATTPSGNSLTALLGMGARGGPNNLSSAESRGFK